MNPNEIRNPEDSTETERKIFDEMKSRFHKLLDDLKQKGEIEKPTQTRLENFLKIVRMVDDDSIVYNILNGIIKDETIASNFLTAVSPFGMTENAFAKLWVSKAISGFNTQTEAFKLAFLIFLKNVNPTSTLGELLGKLEELSPLYAKCITNEIEKQLRNSFAHQLYWLQEDEKKIYYCKNSALQNPVALSFADLMMKAKRQNIIYQAFLNTIAEKVSGGFFN